MKYNWIPGSMASAILTVALWGTAAAAMDSNMAARADHGHPRINVATATDQTSSHSFLNSKNPFFENAYNDMGTTPHGKQMQLAANHCAGAHSFLNSKNPFFENAYNDMGTTPHGKQMQLTAIHQAGAHSFLNSKNPFFENAYNAMG